MKRMAMVVKLTTNVKVRELCVYAVCMRFVRFVRVACARHWKHWPWYKHLHHTSSRALQATKENISSVSGLVRCRCCCRSCCQCPGLLAGRRGGAF